MKSPKTPPLTQKTKILSFDLEANGLHGQAFAIGAVIVDMRGDVIDQFTARIEIEGNIDEWVEVNVLPFITDMPITHATYREMCDTFWRWFVAAQEQSDYVVVSHGYPVEYRFLVDCQDVDLESRYWQHPFPILELPSLLIGAGMVSDTDRLRLVAKIINGNSFVRHHPLHDAKTTALCVAEAFKLLVSGR